LLNAIDFSPRLTLLPYLTLASTLPGHSTSEVTTLRHYTNMCINIIIKCHNIDISNLLLSSCNVGIRDDVRLTIDNSSVFFLNLYVLVAPAVKLFSSKMLQSITAGAG